MNPHPLAVTKTVYEKFLILFVALLIIPFSTWKTSGCGGGDDDADDYLYTFFSPGIIHNKDGFEGYFLTSRPFSDEAPNFDEKNIKEWSRYLSNAYADGFLSHLVYKVSSNAIDSLSRFLNTGDKNSLPELLSPFSITSDKKKLLQSLKYLQFAKNCEAYNPVFDEDSWYQEAKPKTPIPDSIITVGEKSYRDTKDKFLKLRYGFQLMRLYFFSKQFQKGEDFYNKEMAPVKTASTIKERALGYQASCYYRSGDYAHADYIYALMFSQYPDMRNTARYSFHPVEQKDWLVSLSLAKNDSEKIALWHMFGIYADPLKGMEEIYSLNAKSDGMDLLLSRAINIEEQHLTPDKQDINSAYYEPHVYSVLNFDSAKNAASLFSFVKKVADESKTKDPALWDIAAGHVCYLAGADLQSAEKYFAKARGIDTTNKQREEQIRVSELLFHVRDLKKISKEDEQKLYSEIYWFTGNYERGYAPSASHYNRCIENALDFVFKQLSAKYANQRSILKSELCQASRAFYYNNKRTALMLTYMQKTEKSNWETFLMNRYHLKADDILEWQGLQAFYSDNIEIALQKLPGSEKPNVIDPTRVNDQYALPADPFIIHIKDCHDCDHDAVKTVQYSKKAFVKVLIDLKNLAQNDKANCAKYYFELGNGFYNATDNGNIRDFFECRIGDNTFDKEYDRDNMSGTQTPVEIIPKVHRYDDDDEHIDNGEMPLVLNVSDCSRAQKYYQLALDNAKDKEFAAKCCWMIAKCELAESYAGDIVSVTVHDNSTRPGGQFIVGDHMKMLKEVYGNTEYCKEVLNECGYFKTYAYINTH